MLDQISKAKWTTKFINDLPDAAFAVIEPAYKNGETEDKRARHLPHHGPEVKSAGEDASVDLPHLRNALARANQVTPITDSITAEELRAKALAHLQAHAKRLGVGEAAEKAAIQKQARLEVTVEFKKADFEQHIVFGEVYVPGSPENRDTQGQWMSSSEIEKAAHNFLANLRVMNIDKQHNWQTDEGVVVESFIAREGDPDFTPGAWVIGTQIFKQETWDAIMAGQITGFSMAGVATLIPG